MLERDIADAVPEVIKNKLYDLKHMVIFVFQVLREVISTCLFTKYRVVTIFC